MQGKVNIYFAGKLKFLIDFTELRAISKDKFPFIFTVLRFDKQLLNTGCPNLMALNSWLLVLEE